jgi:hypothetical protein
MRCRTVYHNSRHDLKTFSDLCIIGSGQQFCVVWHGIEDAQCLCKGKTWQCFMYGIQNFLFAVITGR